MTTFDINRSLILLLEHLFFTFSSIYFNYSFSFSFYVYATFSFFYDLFGDCVYWVDTNSLNYLLDRPRFGKMFFQDPATSIFEKMVLLHHEILFYMFLLFILVLWFILRINILCGKFPRNNKKWLLRSVWPITKYQGMGISIKKNYFKNFHNKKTIYKHEITLLEILWTLFPAILLFVIAIPSLCLLFLLQPDKTTNFTVRVIGNQWFWTYSNFFHLDFLNNIPEKSNRLPGNVSLVSLSCFTSYDNYLFLRCEEIYALGDKKETFFCKPDSQYLNFQRVIESNLVSTKDLILGDLRLLEVDQRLVLPRNVKIRFLVTSTDVLHSWSIPSLGIKIDACPGRINEVHASIYRKSIFYGQCSEICGILHGFMPIVIQTVSLLDYFKCFYITFPYKF